MASGPTQYKFTDLSGNIQDFYDVFQPGNALITTGFKISNGTDLGNLFLSGQSFYTTNYKNSLGQDLGSLFAPSLPFIPTGASITGIVYGSDFRNSYYYAIFLVPSVQGSVAPNTKFNYTSSSVISFICVGGGGGGGGSRGGASCGGGGGGGTYRFDKGSYNVSSPTYSLTVGAGGSAGTGGSAGIPGGTGGESKVTYNSGANFLVKCAGGVGGTTSGPGDGGFTYTSDNPDPTVFGYGGGGGDLGGVANGEPCYWSFANSRPLLIPPEIVSAQPLYISYYYAGGGGGGKGNLDTSDYSGGQGGGTAPVGSTGSNTGAGGLGGVKDAGATDGYPGNGYGSGGGGGGNESDGTRKPGGAGRQGIVIVYASLQR